MRYILSEVWNITKTCKTRMVLPHSISRVFYALMGQYRGKKQYSRGQYFCQKWIFAYPKRSLYFHITEQSIWHIGLASCTGCHWWVSCCRSSLRWMRLWENFCPFCSRWSFQVLWYIRQWRRYNDEWYRVPTPVFSLLRKFQPRVHCSTPIKY